MTAIRMRRDLAFSTPPPVWAAGFGLRRFTDSDAPAAHRVLCAAYRGTGNEMAAFGPWRSTLRADAEYDQGLVFLAANASGRIVGAAQCWTSGFVKDLGVDPAFRRQGLGRALMLAVFAAFRDRGAAHVDLKVRADNSAAIALYLGVGMTAVFG